MRSALALASLVALAALSAGIAPAHASDDPDLDAAVSLAQARGAEIAAAAPQAPRFAFTVRYERAGYGALVARFDPSAPMPWTLLEPVGDAVTDDHEQAFERIASNLQADQDALVTEADSFASDCTGVSRQGDVLVLTCAAPPADGEDDEFAQMREHVVSEVTIEAADGLPRSYRLYALRPFKPVRVAKIDRFEITGTFAPAWPGGPLVAVAENQDMAGSAMFRSFEETIGISRSQFERVEVADRPADATGGGVAAP